MPEHAAFISFLSFLRTFRMNPVRLTSSRATNISR